MGWSTGLGTALSQSPVRLQFAVETFDTLNNEGVGVPGVMFTTHPHSGTYPWLDFRTLNIGGHAVNLSTWQYERQGWSFGFAANANLRTVAQVLRRGTLVRLRVTASLSGGPPSGWDIVQTGVVSGIRRLQTGAVLVDVFDLLTALKRRLSTSVLANSLFPNAGTATTISGTAYTAGDGTLALASGAGFDELSGSLKDACYVEPSGGGTAFYLTYTGKSGATLSSVDGTAARGTTAVNAAIGSTVTQMAHLTGRPDQIAARILCSTGAGTNGVHDVLPKRWGYALDEALTFDQSNATSTWGNAILGAVSGGYDLDIIADAPVTDGFSWLTGILAAFGIWVCNRQGRLTLRMAQDPYNPLVGPLHTIRNEDVLSAEVEWYDPDRRIQYRNSRATGPTTSASTSSAATISTFPKEQNRDYDLSAYVFSNEANILQDVADRTYRWDTTIPERVKLRLKSASWMEMTPGDLVFLDLPMVAGRSWARGRLDRSVDGYVFKRGMVTRIRPDLLGGYTDVEVAVPPESSADDLQ